MPSLLAGISSSPVVLRASTPFSAQDGLGRSCGSRGWVVRTLTAESHFGSAECPDRRRQTPPLSAPSLTKHPQPPAGRAEAHDLGRFRPLRAKDGVHPYGNNRLPAARKSDRLLSILALGCWDIRLSRPEFPAAGRNAKAWNTLIV